MNSKKTKIGVLIGNRGFFPAHLRERGRGEILRILEEENIQAVALNPHATKFGAVETLADDQECANLLKSHREELDGVIVTPPSFGDKRGLANDRWVKDKNLAASAIPYWTAKEELSGVVSDALMSMMSNTLVASACETDIAGVVGVCILQSQRGARLRYGTAQVRALADLSETYVYATAAGGEWDRTDLLEMIREALKEMFREFERPRVSERWSHGDNWGPRRTLEPFGVLPGNEDSIAPRPVEKEARHED